MPTNITGKRAQQRQKASDITGRLTDAKLLKAMQRYAQYITRAYPLRTWAVWTHHKFGWWNHVIHASWNEVRPTRRDYDDVLSVWQRLKDQERYDAELLARLDAVKVKQVELDLAVDALKTYVKRKERALNDLNKGKHR